MPPCTARGAERLAHGMAHSARALISRALGGHCTCASYTRRPEGDVLVGRQLRSPPRCAASRPGTFNAIFATISLCPQRRSP